MTLKNIDIKKIKEGLCDDFELPGLEFLFTIDSVLPVVVFMADLIVDKESQEGMVGCNVGMCHKGHELSVILVDACLPDVQIVKTLLHESIHAVSSSLNPSKDYIFRSRETEEVYADSVSEFLLRLLSKCFEDKRIKKIMQKGMKC